MYGILINPVQSDVVEREEIMYNHVETVSLCKWGKNVDTYTTLNDALVRLFRDVMDLEERSSEDRRVVYISLSEIHCLAEYHRRQRGTRCGKKRRPQNRGGI